MDKQSVLELKKLREDKVISKKKYKKELVDIFTQNLNFKFSEVIAKGRFSTVLRVRNSIGEEGIALKITLNEDIGTKEPEWAQLEHENILPLLSIESFPAFDLTWFVSPVVDLTLADLLQRLMIQRNSMFPIRAVRWIKETTSALNYMHQKGFCFLNLKLSNVMICEDDTIKIFGFHRLNKIGELTTE